MKHQLIGFTRILNTKRNISNLKLMYSKRAHANKLIICGLIKLSQFSGIIYPAFRRFSNEIQRNFSRISNDLLPSTHI